MKEFKNAKQEYDNITIPKELSERVISEIERAKAENKPRKSKVVVFTKWSAAAAAVVVAIFGIGLNVNPIFARAMEDIPIIGEMARVLTFRQYEVNTEDYVITVEIPTIEMISEDFSDLEESVNREIYTLCEQYAEESRENALKYREAFLETGGTLEEWKEHDIRIKVSYTVQLQTEKYLSLIVKRTESWNSASAEAETFNIDLQSGEQISIGELTDATDTVYYEDVYSVDIEAAVDFAESIREAVVNRDIEKLADLTAFPVYVGLEQGLVIEAREDFIAIGKEKIFAENLVASVTNADISNFTPSRVGFVISTEEYSSNIIFGVVDGQLKITGINY